MSPSAGLVVPVVLYDKLITAVGDSQIIDDTLELIGWDNLTDHLFDLIH